MSFVEGFIFISVLEFYLEEYELNFNITNTRVNEGQLVTKHGPCSVFNTVNNLSLLILLFLLV